MFALLAGKRSSGAASAPVAKRAKALSIRTDRLAVELLPHQVDAVTWMLARESGGLGGLNSCDMGLGKTLQMLATIVSNPVSESDYGTTLLVMPLCLIQQWSEEIRSKLAVSLKIGVYHGPDRHSMSFSDYDVVLATYQGLAADGTAPEKKSTDPRPPGPLLKHSWTRVCLDESQFCKNHATYAARASRELRARYKWALSGTPLQNRVAELYSLLKFLDLPRHRFDSLPAFTRHVAFVKKAAPNIMADISFRRLKSEVFPDLPDKIVTDVSVELSPPERELYDAVFQAAQETIRQYIRDGTLLRHLSEILVMLLRLRQVACHPRLVQADMEYSSKLEAATGLLGQILADTQDKIIIFSSFTKMLDEYRDTCDSYGIKTCSIVGGQSASERNEAIASFKTDIEIRVMLVSIQSGSVGLNLVSANHVIINDVTWNPSCENQATDRAHRLGQTKQVHVYRLIAQDSVEDRILAIQKKKIAMCDYVYTGKITGEEGVGLGEEDIKALFA